MGHAGITPQWDIETAKSVRVKSKRFSPATVIRCSWMPCMATCPNNWSEDLTGLARLRFSTNALTRMRYCFPQRPAGHDLQRCPGISASAAETLV